MAIYEGLRNWFKSQVCNYAKQTTAQIIIDYTVESMVKMTVS